jgi:S-adenosylmethionine synthetase
LFGSEYRKVRIQKTLCRAKLIEKDSHVRENIVKLDVKKRVICNGLTENATTELGNIFNEQQGIP